MDRWFSCWSSSSNSFIRKFLSHSSHGATKCSVLMCSSTSSLVVNLPQQWLQDAVSWVSLMCPFNSDLGRHLLATNSTRHTRQLVTFLHVHFQLIHRKPLVTFGTADPMPGLNVTFKATFAENLLAEWTTLCCLWACYTCLNRLDHTCKFEKRLCQSFHSERTSLDMFLWETFSFKWFLMNMVLREFCFSKTLSQPSSLPSHQCHQSPYAGSTLLMTWTFLAHS